MLIQDEDEASASLLTPADRNFINAHYHSECGALAPMQRRRQPARQVGLYVIVPTVPLVG